MLTPLSGWNGFEPSTPFFVGCPPSEVLYVPGPRFTAKPRMPLQGSPGESGDG